MDNNQNSQSTTFLPSKDLLFVVIASFCAGWIAKLPQLFGWQEDLFYQRNIPFIVFPFLMLLFVWKRNTPLKKMIIPLVVFIGSAVYINMLPKTENSNTVLLACIHLPIFLWSIVGYAFTGNNFRSLPERVAFLLFNGDLLVILAVIQLASGLFTGISFGLFQLIDVNIEKFFIQFALPWGLPALPILATVLVLNNPELVGKVSPIIARIFTPFVFFMLTIFLGAVITTGKDPYNDREFLLVFNALLIGVMAIVLFSMSELKKGSKSNLHLIFLSGLTLVTIVNNAIAFSAILFRLAEYGMSPNRLAVLGSNLIMLIHLIAVVRQLLNLLRKKTEVEKVEDTIAYFLPAYSLWAAVVAFTFPILFHMK